jgi:hypothetical protein
MEPENPRPSTVTPATIQTEPVVTRPSDSDSIPVPVPVPAPAEDPYRGLRWIFIGPQGLRAGWSVAVFFILLTYLSQGIGTVLYMAHLIGGAEDFSPRPVFFGEAGGLLALLLAIAIVGLIEGRRIPAYNLTGPRRPQHFFFGAAAGFLALSALVGTLAAGGWLHFGPVALSGTAIFRFGLIWGCIFLIGACYEEGLCRCFLLFTLTRGINYWWALAACVYLCARLAMAHHFGGNAWGVYAVILIGVIPCFILQQKAAPRSSGFWCAAWVTSAYFGYMHVANPGETWIGIFAAAFIGFVFCVSVRLTGSAWWAIGCHAGWDWAETYFYGTADSGLTPQGCYLTSTPAGNPLWSGGAVGPEGSVLVLGAIVLLLVVVLVYGRLSTRLQSARLSFMPLP